MQQQRRTHSFIPPPGLKYSLAQLFIETEKRRKNYGQWVSVSRACFFRFLRPTQNKTPHAHEHTTTTQQQKEEEDGFLCHRSLLPWKLSVRPRSSFLLQEICSSVGTGGGGGGLRQKGDDAKAKASPPPEPKPVSQQHKKKKKGRLVASTPPLLDKIALLPALLASLGGSLASWVKQQQQESGP